MNVTDILPIYIYIYMILYYILYIIYKHLQNQIIDLE